MLICRKHRKHIKILFKITSQCNQSCEYCSEKPFTGYPSFQLTKEEIVDNYNYLKKRFSINSVILSGGEPTLHSEYFSILDFFFNEKIPLKIITNLLRFNDFCFLKAHERYFNYVDNWLFYGSLSGVLSDESKQRILGLENILRINFPVSLIVLVYHKNIRELPELVHYISKLFSLTKNVLNIELRLIYIKDVPYRVITHAPRDFKGVIRCITTCLKLLGNTESHITIWNFPLCYLNDTYNRYVKHLDNNVEYRRKIKIIKINKRYQVDNFKVRDFQQFLFKDKKCVKCVRFNYCSGINEEYIVDLGFPDVHPIID